MEPDLFEEFAREFLAEVNRQRKSTAAATGERRANMDRIARQIARLAEAIANGADALALNSKLKELEADHERLKTESDDEVRHHPLIHPNLAKIYRQKVEHLRDALRGQAHGREAFELVRSLIEDVCLVPTGGTLDIQLKGDLAGILAISAGAKTDKSPEVKALQIKLVAGACNIQCSQPSIRATFRFTA